MTGSLLAIAVLLLLLAPATAASLAAAAAATALRDGNAASAVRLATEALADPSLTPRDRARVLIDRGLAQEALGERDAALVDFTEAINARALPPAEQARALYDRGVTLDELARIDDAAGDYSAALRLEPKFAAALNNRGNAYRRLGRLAEARVDYLASIAAGNPHPEYPNFGLGQVAEAAGQTGEARGYYQTALTANPQFKLVSDRLAALGPADADTPVVLKQPPAATNTPAAPNDGAIHLRPPGEAVIRLRPPGTAKPAAPVPARLDLKPAFSEGGGLAPGQIIQLGAWRSQGDAANAWSRIAAASGRLLAGLSPLVVPVDLPGKGRYYRLRAGPVSPGDGPSLCAALRTRGLACIVVQS